MVMTSPYPHKSNKIPLWPSVCFFVLGFWFLEIGSHRVALVGLELPNMKIPRILNSEIHLPLPQGIKSQQLGGRDSRISESQASASLGYRVSFRSARDPQ